MLCNEVLAIRHNAQTDPYTIIYPKYRMIWYRKTEVIFWKITLSTAEMVKLISHVSKCQEKK